jgi:hypothetical protein
MRKDIRGAYTFIGSVWRLQSTNIYLMLSTLASHIQFAGGSVPLRWFYVAYYSYYYWYELREIQCTRKLIE